MIKTERPLSLSMSFALQANEAEVVNHVAKLSSHISRKDAMKKLNRMRRDKAHRDCFTSSLPVFLLVHQLLADYRSVVFGTGSLISSISTHIDTLPYTIDFHDILPFSISFFLFMYLSRFFFLFLSISVQLFVARKTVHLGTFRTSGSRCKRLGTLHRLEREKPRKETFRSLSMSLVVTLV